jgi:NAD(P)-dependent dehydrogenase (short-subunit alcohol dehydrogenase family)
MKCRETAGSEVVVVTGASAGVGRAIAREFARHGASVGLLARGGDGLGGAERDVDASAAARLRSKRTFPMTARSNRPWNASRGNWAL